MPSRRLLSKMISQLRICDSDFQKLGYWLEQGAEENIWTKEGWSDGRVEKAV
jgi:hypothetical protein